MKAYPLQLKTDLRHVDSAGVVKADHRLYRLSRDKACRRYFDAQLDRAHVEAAEAAEALGHLVVYAELTDKRSSITFVDRSLLFLYRFRLASDIVEVDKTRIF